MVATLPSDVAIIASFIAYRLIHRYVEGPNPSLPRLSAVISGTTTLHSSITTILVVYFLRQCQTQWAERVLHNGKNPAIKTNTVLEESSSLWQEITDGNGRARRYPDDSTNPLLQTRSTLGNTITAIECGFLLQDTISLLHEALLRLRLAKPGLKPNIRLLLQYADKTLLAHHIGIALALLVFHYYVHQDRDRGIYIIVQFLLMNSSTPVLNLRWWLRTYHPNSRLLCLCSDLAFVAAFYMARVWLVGWIIREYGKSHGYASAWKIYFEGMRLPCQMGTGALWIANTAWWTLLVISVAKRLPKELARIGEAMHSKKS
ncbi:MAG: hypothetical protein LQ341_003846 [Variospora aurantia]|nr:MAG: hypothetical protein LQ341_003846 [Variospora aurantia]